MRNSIAVMNAKGGVGKSTLVLAMAETLSATFAKNVLVIDADAQASVSLMLLSAGNLNRLQLDGMTIVDLLVASVLNNEPVDWPRFIVSGVSDVDQARTVYLIPSDMQLTLFEREVAKEGLLVRLRASIGALLGSVREMFDVIMIDCAPGLSVLTESMLREADFHLAPVNPDHVSAYALEVLAHFKGLNPEMGLAENLGVLINMKEAGSEDADAVRRLTEKVANRCFEQAIPRTSSLQHASRFNATERSYATKYPGASGEALEFACRELLVRLAEANAAHPASPAPAASVAPASK
jgi:chromosome partitioning protein